MIASKAIESTLSRPQIQAIFRRHKGSVVRLAKQLGVSHVSISLWLKGTHTSARIAQAAQAQALELLKIEDSPDAL